MRYLRHIKIALDGMWPLPALLVWFAAWGILRLSMPLGLSVGSGLIVASAVGVLSSLWGQTWWRRLLIASGFPLSFIFSSLNGAVSDVSAWIWLLLLALLLMVYPLNTWRDAPLFPTPRGALAELPALAPLPDGALVLDAGCGLGHGLRELRAAYPNVKLHGMEWSWPLRWLAAMRCPWALVRRADMWEADWGVYDMVYLFQRPESMERVMAKAARELRPGAWVVSLEFEARDFKARYQSKPPGGRMAWLYQSPFRAISGE